MTRRGIIIAPEGQRTNPTDHHMILNTDIPQFKYRTTLYYDLVFSSDSTAQPIVSITVPHNLFYKPAFSVLIRGYNGYWGRIAKGLQSLGFGGWDKFPYSGTEEVDNTNYYATLQLVSPAVTIPAHTVKFRITLLYDEMSAP